MKWSWKVGRLFGIDTEIHASFVLLLAWVLYGAVSSGGTLSSGVYALLFLAGLFASVVLHELGHALAARSFGVQTRRILLLPIGGMAQLEGMPRSPRAELIVAVAGPAVSLLLAGLFAVGSSLLPAGSPLAGSGLDLFVGNLMWANLMLGVFNMTPAFPMDGGRALRAALATQMPYLRATEIAVRLGKFAAVALGVAGLFGNPWLMVIAMFIWFSASAELRALRWEASTRANAPLRVEVLINRVGRPRSGLASVGELALGGFRPGSDVTWHEVPRWRL